MHYSFTEKKRIRKSFAKRDNVHQVPFLLATQLESYESFLQADVPPLKRKNEGLQSAFTSIFPIVSHNGFARLEFISYTLGDPPFDVKECQQRGLTLARKGTSGHSRQGIADETGRQGNERTGSLYGRIAPDDNNRFFCYQWHGTRYRFPVASFSWRVLRTRQGQDTFVRKTAVFRTYHSLPRFMA